MNILAKLFGRRQAVTLEELRSALQDVERDRRRNHREMRRWERKRKQLLDRMKKLRREDASLEVDYLWEEFKEHRKLGGELRRQGRVYNLEGLALRRTVHALERLDRRRDQTGARQLLERIAASGLAERVALDRESELRQLEELNGILEDFSPASQEEAEDPEKLLFLAGLDSVVRAESEGDSEGAAEREAELLDDFERDADKE